MNTHTISRKVVLLVLIITTFLISGCNFPWEGQDKGLDAGYYKRIYLLPHGQFVGIEKVNGEAAHKGVVYKVELDELKRIKEVVAVYNDKPINVYWGLDLVNVSNRFAKIVINYEDNGNMTYNFLSDNDKPVSWQADIAAIRFTNSNKSSLPDKAEYLTTDMTPVSNNGHDLIAKFTYNHNLLETIKLSGWLKSGDDLQLKFYYDSNFIMHRLPVGMESTDMDGRLYPFLGDVARIVWQYDKQNRLIKKQFLGADGEMVNGNMSIYTLVFDQIRGNYERYCSYFTCSYDENNFSPNKISFYNANGELWSSKSTASVTPQPIYRFTYNNDGDLTKIETENADGNAAELYADIYGKGYAYDDVGNIKELTYYDADGQPALTKAKYAKWRRVCDTHRRVSEVAYFGINDEKVNAALRNDGKIHYYHKLVVERNSDGSVSQYKYYNANGKQTK
ncbi:hypothetical protein [Selenomonas ruminantium]|uniref:hypothetical protein n=1 Tax=Selenomonas ruminantium TaxID=971 RepID=UPI00047C12A6|nr:hypothetical protein [Selenomonas ruminantium]